MVQHLCSRKRGCCVRKLKVKKHNRNLNMFPNIITFKFITTILFQGHRFIAIKERLFLSPIGKSHLKDVVWWSGTLSSE